MAQFAGFVHLSSQVLPDPAPILQRLGHQLSCQNDDPKVVVHQGALSLICKQPQRLCPSPRGHKQSPSTFYAQSPAGNKVAVLSGHICNLLELKKQLQWAQPWESSTAADVILQGYIQSGPAIFSRLNGSFALLIWDGEHQQLLLARDPLGMKPLYYTQVNNQLIFGTYLKALLAHPDCPNQPQWLDLSVLSPTTSYVQDVQRLAGGHYLTFDAALARLELTCYWSLKSYLATGNENVGLINPVNKSRPSFQDSIQHYIQGYGDRFAASIATRLIPNQPMGVLLSGGLDSGLVMAAAHAHAVPLHCFTILESYTLDNGDAQAAQQLCKTLDVPFYPILFDREALIQQLNFSLESFEYFIWLLDMPRFELEWLFKHELHRYARTHWPDITVTWLGQGADEFTGGYSNPDDQPSEDWQTYTQLRAGQEQPLTDQERQVLSENPQAKAYLDAFQFQRDQDIAGYTPFQSDMLSRVASLQNYNLWHEDRSAFAQGIDLRIPFLDHHLVEYLAGIPIEFHSQLFWNKTIVREAAKPCLPEDYANRPKSHRRPPSSLHLLRQQLLSSIFPAFQEKYLETGKGVFSMAKMRTWAEIAQDAGVQGQDAMRKLFNGIAMTVFQELCDTRCQDVKRDLYQGDSPLYSSRL